MINLLNDDIRTNFIYQPLNYELKNIERSLSSFRFSYVIKYDNL